MDRLSDEYGATKMYQGEASWVVGTVMLSRGGERSGRDLYCQSAKDRGRKVRESRIRIR